MAEDDSEEKTEEPTPRKREKAKEDGQIVTSKEMFVFSSIALMTMMIAGGQSMFRTISASWALNFNLSAPDGFEMLMMERLQAAVSWIILAGIIVGVPLMIITILTQAGVGGLNFSTKALGFKANKLDPLKGMKRMVSAKSLVELTKAVLKVVLLIGVSFVVILPYLPALDRLNMAYVGDGMAVFGKVLTSVLMALTGVLGLIGAIDLAWNLYSNNKKLKMSRKELKDEMKESEGSPEVKGQIRRKQMEASRMAAERASVANVDMATAIVTNPQHFAVALQYKPELRDAPVILAMGTDVIAQQIRERGKTKKIKTVESPPLARALYFTGEIGSEIPPDLYAAVAILLAHVWRLEHGLHEDTPEIDLPPELRLDSLGRPEQRRYRT